MPLARVCICAWTCAMLAGTALAQEKPTANPPLPDRLHIRAVLGKSVDAGKVKADDAVVLQAAEAELVDGKVVIAEGAKLTGRVVEAVPFSPGHESRLAIVVERAEWKHQSVPLHAFIVAQGQATSAKTVAVRDCRREAERTLGQADVALAASRCDDVVGSLELAPQATPTIAADVRLVYVKGREGPTVLISRQNTIVLKSGTLLLLRQSGQPDAQ